MIPTDSEILDCFASMSVTCALNYLEGRGVSMTRMENLLDSHIDALKARLWWQFSAICLICLALLTLAVTR
jgi:hypothetical protein